MRSWNNSPRWHPGKKDAVEVSRIFSKYYLEEGRDFPWRKEGVSSYQLIVTEVLLRRTAAPKVASIWKKFFEQFPTVEQLSEGNLSEIKEAIKELGLQEMRSRHLKDLARNIVENQQILAEPKRLMEEKNLGQYITGSFLLQRGNYSHPPVDINVKRVFTRLLGQLYFDRTSSQFYEEVLKAGDDKRGILFGLLDLSSEKCRPTNPKCDSCSLEGICQYLGKNDPAPLSRKYLKGQRVIVSISAKEYKEILNESSLLIDCRAPRNKTAIVYVKNPVKSIVGHVKLRKKGNMIELYDFCQIQKRITLEILQNRWRGFNLRGHIMWISKTAINTLFSVSN